MSVELERYRPIIDDWASFVAAVNRPEPTTLRVNRTRLTRDDLAERLREQGFEVAALPGQPDFLRVLREPFGISDTLEHWAGLFYIQQATTGLAAPLLDPGPGERVLDLCAAPGGKTTHLAELMHGRGPLVAAEVNDGRIRALLGNLYRLGHTNVMVVGADGRTLPTEARFQRVMVDVPCSAQGTIRKKGGRLPSRSRRFMKQVTRAQEKLLRRAVDLTLPGGTILYVTCTFGPEENEAVVSRVLADAPVEVDPLEPPVPHARGVTRFEDARYDPRLEGAVRLYPHHLDSGGLFLCRLRRLDDGDPVAGDPAAGWRPVPDTFPGDPAPDDPSRDVSATLELLASHYGVAGDVLADRHWIRRGSNLWLHGCDAWPIEDWTPGGHWRLVAMGLRAVDLGGDGPPRPTNDLLQWLDDAVVKNRVELDERGWRALLDGRGPSLEGVERGHVALALRGRVVGWGFVRDGQLHSHVPRGRASWLRSVVAEPSEERAGSHAEGAD